MRCEQRLRVMDSLTEQMTGFDLSLRAMMPIEQRIYKLEHYNERTQPMLTHIQICEALNIVAGS